MKSTTTFRSWYILPVIILSQFAGTSLWFAGNAVLTDLRQALQLPEGALGNMTSAVQLGFITGTLSFAFLMVADRFSPSRVFFFSALLGAFFNLCMVLFPAGFLFLLAFRFLTGFFLAGIYPVGMKIASDWYAEGLGKALGYLVGALVLGTAFPHLLRFSAQSIPWEWIFLATSCFALIGGGLIFLLVPDGPNRRRGSQFHPGVILRIFRFPEFRSAAFGYFGHMWELYAFWAFVPVILAEAGKRNQEGAIQVSLGSFLIIAMGTLGCIIGGYRSMQIGSKKVAFAMLAVSGLCCLLSPFALGMPSFFFFLFLLIWGFSVVGDSPQFSSLVARSAPKEYVGSALTIVNSIGFLITIFSIELLNFQSVYGNPRYMFLALAPGPAFGLWAISRSKL